VKALLHMRKKSYACILNFEPEAINLNTMMSKGRAVQNRGAVFLHHCTARDST